MRDSAERYTQTFHPLVSMIIPVYNGSNYMREAIDSALAQTYDNIEILVINDGSKDNGETERIAKTYGDRIRYIYKENGGVSTALNTGIRNMKGEYFSWLSHDDAYLPEKIEKQVEALSQIEDKKALVSCGSVHMDKNSDLIGELLQVEKNAASFLSWDTVLMNLLQKGTMNGCTLLIHRDVFADVGFFDERLRFNQDGFMWDKIFLKGYSMLSLPFIGVKNRIHEKQLTQTGQSIFRGDCEKMSDFLIPELISKSRRDQNFILAYIKYNAKYGVAKVGKRAFAAAKEAGLISWKEQIGVAVWWLYGIIRPTLRKIYYRLFRGMKTS